MAQRPVVVIGFLGSSLDRGHDRQRWDRWRPTVALCSQDDLLVSRLELLHDPKSAALTATVTEDIGRLSPETVVRPSLLEVADPWSLEQVYGALHDFARAYPFKPEREDYLIHITTGTHVAQICLFLLTESRHLPGRLLQTSPPRRGEGAAGSYTIIDLDLSKYDRLATRFAREQQEGLDFLKSGIATKNAAFNRLIERIERVAIASRAPLLLTGPTGAGKSQLARRIYELKKARRQVAGDFVEVNCATLRGDGAMSALFGHERGAFTGAVKDRPGLLRRADGGVLFLDEIGELGGDEQAMLLRAIEEKRFLPVGGDREVQSDFQLLAGTNRDLGARVVAGAFREDLLARINLWTFRMPGLRERVEDIEPNLDYELERAATTVGTRVTFSREARARFLSFAVSPEARWPGNFRDFNAAVLRMATLAHGGRIDVGVVEEELIRQRQGQGMGGSEPERGSRDEVARLLGPERATSLDRFDRVQLADVIAACQEADSLSAAGRALFAASLARRTSSNDADRLRKYLARFGLDWSQVNSLPRSEAAE